MLTIVNNIENSNAITHSGTFHSDDVLSAVFLNKIMDLKLYRASHIKDNFSEDKIIFDIGYTEFDHHGPNARMRENKIKYCSFGLLFENFGKDYLKTLNVKNVEQVYELLLKEFIIHIDAIDNGVFVKNPKDYEIITLPSVISFFNPTWLEDKTSDECFQEAFFVTEKIFDRIIKRTIDKSNAQEFVEEAISKSENNILVLDRYMPFLDFVIHSEQEKAKTILFAIFPSNRGGFNIKTLRDSIDTTTNRLDFPSEWGGKSEEDLTALTGIFTFQFCHTSLFLCSCLLFEDAVKIANLALKQTK